MKGKKGYIIGVSIIILVFGLWVIKNFKYRYQNDMLLQPDKVSGLKTAPDAHKNKTKDTQVGYIMINDQKLKAPNFKFIDQHKDSISQKDYEGKVYVVEFFYTTCPTICPIMNENLGEIADTFKDNKKFGIASFSIDPQHDTPEVLEAYAKNHGIVHPNWHLMTGDQEELYRLAQNDYKLTAQEDPNEPGGILHDGMFALIDKDGYFRSRTDEHGNPILYYRGFVKRDARPEVGQEEPQINELIEDIKALLHE